jgi:HSP20 family molecular chaperone IbpA
MARKIKESFMIQEDHCGKSRSAFEFQYFEVSDERAIWNPNMDILETEKEIIVLIEAAGIQEDTLQVHAIDNRLVVSGERHLTIPDTIRHYHQLEIQFMPFQKTVILPGTVDSAHIIATYAKGMLDIRVSRKHLKQGGL